MSYYRLLAEAFCYPYPGQLEAIQTELSNLSAGLTRDNLSDFMLYMQQVPLADREELYTRTLDLNPPVAPYIGYQIWEESYQRGSFMSELQREMNDLDIDTEGELPDHIIPVLRYLEAASSPLPELVENLETAVRKMLSVLSKSEKENPYIFLFMAVLSAVEQQKVEQQVKA